MIKWDYPWPMTGEDYYFICSKYINRENKGVPDSEKGLVKDAPAEAIEAYEEYKKIDARRTDPNIDY